MKKNNVKQRKKPLKLMTVIKKDFKKNKMLWAMGIPVILWYIIFAYIPMCGVVIGFQNFSVARGIGGSTWVGLDNFRKFFESYYAGRLIKNTLILNLYQLLFVFPAPILLALLLNEVRNNGFKKVIQTVTYLPHFVSMTILCGMIVMFCAKDGLISQLCGLFGVEATASLLNYSQYYRGIYIATDIWAGIGWGSIIYIAALSGINPELYEAATIDGANRFQKIRYITLPGLLPTIVTMLLLNISSLMSLGSGKTILIYNANIYDVADIISSFVYRRGIIEADYSFSSAVGLFNSIVNLLLVLLANAVSKKVTGEGLWGSRLK